MSLVIREFIKTRNGRDIVYPFTIDSKLIFEDTELDKKHTENQEYWKLLLFCRDVFLNGHPEKDYKSVSQQAPYIVPVERQDDKSLIPMAQAADYREGWKFQHEKVQRFFIKKDPFTVATELPVWDDDTLGHIDIVRWMPFGKIQVLDFKPKAHTEKFAACQVDRYIRLLMERLRLPRSKFEGAYFDDTNAYFLK